MCLYARPLVYHFQRGKQSIFPFRGSPGYFRYESYPHQALCCLARGLQPVSAPLLSSILQYFLMPAKWNFLELFS